MKKILLCAAALISAPYLIGQTLYYGKANSMLVSQAGVYSMDVAPRYTDSPVYAYQDKTGPELPKAASAELLWQTKKGLITQVSLSEDATQLSFSASDQKGNALIAIKDKEGRILWCFHVWITEQPQLHKYKNGLTVMDRNLGATSAQVGNGNALGLMYQWGRKDPFRSDMKIVDAAGKSYKAVVDYTVKSTKETGTVEWAVQNPTTLIVTDDAAKDWCFQTRRNALWGNPEGYANPSVKSIPKSIYDPCPEGYKVAPKNVWSNFSKETCEIDGTNKGILYSEDQFESWYPVVGWRSSTTGNYAEAEFMGCYWSSAPVERGNEVFILQFNVNKQVIHKNAVNNRASCRSVRCVKE